MNFGQSLTSFFQVMYQRMVERATRSNAQTRGTAANTTDASGNLGAGAVPIGNIAVYPDPKSVAYVKDGYSGNATIYSIISLISRKFGHLPFEVLEVKDERAMKQYKHYMKTWTKDSKRREAKALFNKAYSAKREFKTFKVRKEVKADSYFVRVNGYRKQAEEDTVYATTTTDDLEALLGRPNPEYGADQFQEYLDIYYESNGEAIIWLNRGTDNFDIPLTEGPVLEMYVLPPQYMEMIPDPYNVWGSLGWIFNVAGKRIPIDNENILHWKKPNPNFDGVTREHMRGMSPMRPARKKITEDEAAADASVAMHQNNGARGIAFDKNLTGPAAKMSPTKESEIRRVIDNKVNHTDMKGAVAYIQGDLGYIDVGMSSVDQELEDAKGNILARLCNVWGVSPDLLMQGSTYQNVLQARKDLMTNKVLPSGCSFLAELTRKLLPAFGMNPKNYSIEIDATVIPELQDNMLELVQALKQADWLTPDEKREEMNYEALGEDYTDKLWTNNTMVLMEDAAMPEQNPDSFDPNAPDTDPAVEEARKIANNGSTGKDK